MSPDSEIVKGCVRCNIRSQEALFKKYGAEIKQLCYRYANTSEDAKDIFQETFIKIFKSIGDYRQEGPLIGWMKRIAVNTSVSFYRKKNRLPSTSIYEDGFMGGQSFEESVSEYFMLEESLLTDDESNDIEMALSLLNYEQIVTIIKSLDPPQNIIFNMFYIENFSHREIANQLNISESNCRTLLFRAKKKLKGCIRVLIQQSSKVS